MVGGLLVIVTAMVALPGCQSSKQPGSSSLAAVIVPCNNSNAIYEATLTVFQGSGWTLSEPDRDTILFHREGTKRDNRLYGNWGEPVWLWAEVRIQPYGTIYLLRCDSYVVRHPSEGLGMDNTKMRGRFSAGPYKDMLERVKKKVGPKPG